MTIVTGGKKFTDIDCLACAVAYAKLLNLQGKSAQAILPGTLNNTVSQTIKQWQLDFYTKTPEDVSEIIIVDISEPSVIESDWDASKIMLLFDHHYGHEKYWQEKLGQNSHIEAVGACATQIWEEWTKANLDAQIDTTTANLLSAAIMSNTLNFNASVTTDRDIKAYKDLKKFTNLPENWIQGYYQEIEQSVVANPKQAVLEDTKIVTLPNLNETIAIGQLELWDGKQFISKNEQIILEALSTLSDHWLMTVPSISEGKNYLYTQSQKVQGWLSTTIGAKFSANHGTTSKLFLRKEILRQLQSLTVH